MSHERWSAPYHADRPGGSRDARTFAGADMAAATGRQWAGRVWAAIGAAIGMASLYTSTAHPVWGGIGSGALVGMLLAFAQLTRTSAPRVSAGLAIAGLVTALAQGWLSFSALGPGAVAATIAFLLWYLLVNRIGLGMVNRERTSPLVNVGGLGTAGRALIVYHSVGGTFQPAVERGLAEGLQTQGWRVDMTTASAATPTRLADYQLLVLGVPVFASQPAAPILRYLERLGDLAGFPVLLVVSGQGTTEHG